MKSKHSRLLTISEGSVIRRMIAERQWTFAMFADRLQAGFAAADPTRHLRRVLQGEKPLTELMKQRMAKTFGINADEFEQRLSTFHLMGSIAPGIAPAYPSLLIGRDKAVDDLRTRLSERRESSLQVLTAIRGWPGVGKTTLAARMAHDRELMDRFPDGVLWTSLGSRPDIPSELASWSRALNVPEPARVRDPEKTTARLRAQLRERSVLLIVDDVWAAEHVDPFRVGGAMCAMLVTTRDTALARTIAARAKDVYKLDVLNAKASMELLKLLAPGAVDRHPDGCRRLVRELEGLPLAVQVAGRLLHAEADSGFDVAELLDELRSGVLLLNSEAPLDQRRLAGETTPTIAVLLRRSVNRLDLQTQRCFAMLSACRSKPASFDLSALRALWNVRDASPRARLLVDRGLLEPLGQRRFQMHALLVMLANSMLLPDGTTTSKS